MPRVSSTRQRSSSSSLPLSAPNQVAPSVGPYSKGKDKGLKSSIENPSLPLQPIVTVTPMDISFPTSGLDTSSVLPPGPSPPTCIPQSPDLKDAWREDVLVDLERVCSDRQTPQPRCPLSEDIPPNPPNSPNIDESLLEQPDSFTPAIHIASDTHDISSPEQKVSGTYDIDLASSIRGMYRILTLLNEQGSGGLVNKIVIDQVSLERIVNDICPGAYVSMTKINFSILDSILIQPLGIYGSRSEIARFLRDLDVIDPDTYVTVSSSPNQST